LSKLVSCTKVSS